MFNLKNLDLSIKDTYLSVGQLIENYLIIPQGFNERHFLETKMQNRNMNIIKGTQINYLELIMSVDCNFACSYCIHFKNKNYTKTVSRVAKFMSYETGVLAIDEYLSILRENNNLTAEINFGGGEPLMNWRVIELLVKYCLATHKFEFEFIFSINTNASLITNKIALFCKKHNIEIASSLDGLQKGNDKVRLTRLGKGTFFRIVKGFSWLKCINYPLKGFSVTINDDNFSFLDKTIIDWARNQEFEQVRIDIDVIGAINTPLELIVQKLMEIRVYAAKNGIDVPGFWSRPAENLNESSLSEWVSFCGAVRGNSICVDPLGDIYACGYSDNKLGNITNLKDMFVFGSKYYSLISGHLTGKNELCKGCIIEGQCAGGCEISSEYSNSHKNMILERRCEFYRLMTVEIIKEQLRQLTEQ